MTELVERYVHQVGRYVAPRERAEIEAELRSQIQDQLDDRYGASPDEAEVSAVLAELGHPYRIAASYGSDQYLVGPQFYPYMRMVLRRVWLILPAIIIALGLFEAFVSTPPGEVLNKIVETLLNAAESTLIVSAFVVLFFAAFERAWLKNKEFAQEMEEQVGEFKPQDLPQVDDPRSIDRFETVFGIVFGALATLVFLYFLRVGGLTLRFNLTDPGEVIPVPQTWMILFILIALSMMILQLLVLRRRRWVAWSWLVQTLLELAGTFSLYFVLYLPVFDRLVQAESSLSDVPLPQLLVVLGVISTLLSRGGTLLRLWNERSDSPVSSVYTIT